MQLNKAAFDRLREDTLNKPTPLASLVCAGGSLFDAGVARQLPSSNWHRLCQESPASQELILQEDATSVSSSQRHYQELNSTQSHSSMGSMDTLTLLRAESPFRKLEMKEKQAQVLLEVSEPRECNSAGVLVSCQLPTVSLVRGLTGGAIE